MYNAVEKNDEQSVELLREVMDKIARMLEIPRGAQDALSRIRYVSENASKGNAGMLRNNIFKAANSLGIKLPSGSF